MCTSSSSLSLAAKQDVFPYMFPHPGLEVAGGMSSGDQCAVSPNRIAAALGPGLCLLSSIFSPRVLVQLGDTLAHLVAASLCPEGCSELVSLPSVGSWCDHGVNVLCYSQAAHLCSPLLASPPTVPSLLPHTMGVCPFPSHAGITLPLVLLVESLLQPSSSHSPCFSPTQALPALHTPSMAAGSAPLLCALSWVPLPSAPSQQPPCHQDIASEEKWGGWFNLPSPGCLPGAWPCNAPSPGR